MPASSLEDAAREIQADAETLKRQGLFPPLRDPEPFPIEGLGLAEFLSFYLRHPRPEYRRLRWMLYWLLKPFWVIGRAFG